MTRVKHESMVKARVGWHGLKSDDFTEEGPYLVTGSDFLGPTIQWGNCYHCDISRYEQDPNIQLKNGDLLITKDGTIGKVALVEGLDGQATLNSGVFVVRPLTTSYTSRFYFWLLQSKVFTSFVDFNKTGSTISHLYQDTFVNFSYALPSLPEQTKIAAFLDFETGKIDALIAKQERLIALLEEKRQAVISHAVTKGLNPNAPLRPSGIDWLGDVPEHWEVARIKHLAITISKGTTPSTIGGDLVSHGIRFLKAENIGKSVYASAQPEFYISPKVDEDLARSRLQDQDVLVIIAGATTGLASVIGPELIPANTNQAVSFIRPKELMHAHFIMNWLGTEFAQRHIWVGAVQAAQPNLSMETLGNIPIAVPPKREVELILDTISKANTKFSDLLGKAQSAISLLKERRTALISAAVTGKIDVRDWQLPEEATVTSSPEISTQDFDQVQEAIG
ncbi:restriction endonuclease subunit S [Celeribacter sp. ULVN23_4]